MHFTFLQGEFCMTQEKSRARLRLLTCSSSAGTSNFRYEWLVDIFLLVKLSLPAVHISLLYKKTGQRRQILCWRLARLCFHGNSGLKRLEQVTLQLRNCFFNRTISLLIVFAHSHLTDLLLWLNCFYVLFHPRQLYFFH